MNEKSWFCRKVWTHDTGVLLFRQNKGQSKGIIMRSLLAWRCNTGLTSNYRPFYKEEEGGKGVRSIFLVRRGCISYSLSLGYRILRTHICQLSLEKVQKERIIKSNFQPSEVKRGQQISAVCSPLFSSIVAPTLHTTLSLENTSLMFAAF